MDRLLLYLIKSHMIIILILGLILWIIFKKRKNYDNQEITSPKFKTASSIQSQLLNKIIIANKLNYREFSYEKIFDFEGGKLVVNNYNKYQHMNFFIKDPSKEIYYENADIQLRGGNFRNTYFFVENRTIEPMQYIVEWKQVIDFESVMIVMDKKVKDTSIDFEDRIYHHHEDNFPRSIEFFNKGESILFLIFNELGFMIKAIDEAENTIFEDKEILGSEDIRKLIKKNLKSNIYKGE